LRAIEEISSDPAIAAHPNEGPVTSIFFGTIDAYIEGL
jgi:hypothetical protein